MPRTSRLVLPALLVFALAACAQKLPDSVAITPQVDATPLQVAAEPSGKLGRTVLWGGQIIGVTVEEDSTLLEVLEQPLDSSGEPLDTDQPGGRFLARHKGFLEPEIYKPGRLVTVSGSIATIVTQPVGKRNYSYPVVEATGLHLWKERKEAPVYFYDPYYDPYHGGPSLGIGVHGPVHQRY